MNFEQCVYPEWPQPQARQKYLHGSCSLLGNEFKGLFWNLTLAYGPDHPSASSHGCCGLELDKTGQGSHGVIQRSSSARRLRPTSLLSSHSYQEIIPGCFPPKYSDDGNRIMQPAVGLPPRPLVFWKLMKLLMPSPFAVCKWWIVEGK